jgi:hypothetical protein
MFVNAVPILHDPETFKEYPPRVATIYCQKHGAKLLAMDTEANAYRRATKKDERYRKFPSEQSRT